MLKTCRTPQKYLEDVSGSWHTICNTIAHSEYNSNQTTADHEPMKTTCSLSVDLVNFM